MKSAPVQSTNFYPSEFLRLCSFLAMLAENIFSITPSTDHLQSTLILASPLLPICNCNGDFRAQWETKSARHNAKISRLKTLHIQGYAKRNIQHGYWNQRTCYRCHTISDSAITNMEPALLKWFRKVLEHRRRFRTRDEPSHNRFAFRAKTSHSISEINMLQWINKHLSQNGTERLEDRLLADADQNKWRL